MTFHSHAMDFRRLLGVVLILSALAALKANADSAADNLNVVTVKTDGVTKCLGTLVNSSVGLDSSGNPVSWCGAVLTSPNCWGNQVQLRNNLGGYTLPINGSQGPGSVQDLNILKIMTKDPSEVNALKQIDPRSLAAPLGGTLSVGSQENVTGVNKAGTDLVMDQMYVKDFQSDFPVQGLAFPTLPNVVRTSFIGPYQWRYDYNPQITDVGGPLFEDDNHSIRGVLLQPGKQGCECTEDGKKSELVILEDIVQSVAAAYKAQHPSFGCGNNLNNITNPKEAQFTKCGGVTSNLKDLILSAATATKYPFRCYRLSEVFIHGFFSSANQTVTDRLEFPITSFGNHTWIGLVPFDKTLKYYFIPSSKEGKMAQFNQLPNVGTGTAADIAYSFDPWRDGKGSLESGFGRNDLTRFDMYAPWQMPGACEAIFRADPQHYGPERPSIYIPVADRVDWIQKEAQKLACRPPVARTSFCSDLGGEGHITDFAVSPADGKLVAAGICSGTDDITGKKYYSRVVLRFKSNGLPDLGFGDQGRVVIDGRGSADNQAYSVNSIAVQTDGKIVVINDATTCIDFTTSISPWCSAWVVRRLNADGSSFDGSFGRVETKTFADPWSSSHGTSVDTTIGDMAVATSVKLQPDGKIVVGGWVAPKGALALARYNPDGSLDSSFGNQGTVLTYYLDPSIPQSDLGKVIGFTPAGNAVVTGYVNSFPRRQCYLVEYNADGSIGWKTATGYNGQCPGYVQPDGRIISGGFMGTNLVTQRFFADGTPDTTLNVPFGFVSFWDRVFHGGVQDNGLIYTAQSRLPGSLDVLRYLPDGTPDSTFGTNGAFPVSLPGVTVSSFGPLGLAPRSDTYVELLPDGTIAIAGDYTDANGVRDFFTEVIAP